MLDMIGVVVVLGVLGLAVWRDCRVASNRMANGSRSGPHDGGAAWGASDSWSGAGTFGNWGDSGGCGAGGDGGGSCG